MPGRTLKQALNDANPNIISDAARLLKMGTHLSGVPAQCRVPVVSNQAVLPEGLRVAALLAVFATAGTVTGAMSVVTAAPATTQAQISPDGQVNFFATDAVTEVELVFVPVAGDLIEEEVILDATGLGTLGGQRSAKVLISTLVTTGVQAGTKTTIARAGAATTAQAALTTNGKGVKLNVAAAGARATIKYISSAALGLSTAEVLTTDQSNI